jgi:hypothetical protein
VYCRIHPDLEGSGILFALYKLAHAAGGFTLALGLLILFPRTQTAVMVVVLSLVWELIEWTIGLPLVVSVVDTQIDLLAGWLGLAIALLGTTLAPTGGGSTPESGTLHGFHRRQEPTLPTDVPRGGRATPFTLVEFVLAAGP